VDNDFLPKLPHNQNNLIHTSSDQRSGLEALLQALNQYQTNDGEPHGECFLIGPQGEKVPIPASAFFVLKQATAILSRGNAVTLVPWGKQLTTQQAADLLNISRQYLIRILDEGKIAYSKVGTHRRLRIEDVLYYKETRDRERKNTLQELTSLSEELGGYDFDGYDEYEPPVSNE
jgi:excisionase family DNA binding protein